MSTEKNGATSLEAAAEAAAALDAAAKESPDDLTYTHTLKKPSMRPSRVFCSGFTPCFPPCFRL